jgi:putative transposase
VVVRVERAFEAFVRRLKSGDTPGYPRFHSRTSYHSFDYSQVGDHGGAPVDNDFLLLSKIGRIRARWSRSLEGALKTVTIRREADGWYVPISCVDGPVHSLPPTGQETGIDLGIEVFATRSDGTRVVHPGWYRQAGIDRRSARSRLLSAGEVGASAAVTGGATR